MTKNKLPVRFTGQHFTIDKVLIEDAIKQSNITQNETVLDIGAGKGFITVHLQQKAKSVIAIENDFKLVKHLKIKFKQVQNVQIIGCDFREYKIPRLSFKVVSNIPYGITSEVLKILMFENVENFLGGTIILQLEAVSKLFTDKIYNPYVVLFHTFYDLRLLYEINPKSFMPPPTVKSALLRIERKPLVMDFNLKVKYLQFISFLLQKPDLIIKTALKILFRKNQVRSISEKFGINLDSKIVCLSVNQWKICFQEMLSLVPEKFHP
jgi:Dimethyladenosine transferase (rRNA methylation)